MTEDSESDSKRNRLLWRLILQYGIGAAILVFYVTVSLHFQYTPDDTYVYLQIGRNIARGEGFSFNAGNPSYGVTGPLWAFLIAAGVKMSLDPYIVAKTLDILFAGLTVIAVLAFAFVLIRDRIYALVAACIFSFDCWLLRWSGSGVETSLGMLLMMMAIWYAYRKEYILSSMIAGLLTLVRPEGFLLFVAILVDLVLNARERTSVRRTFISSLLLYGIVVGSWILYSLTQFATIIPNTLHAKSAAGFSLQALWQEAVSNLELVGATQIILALFLVAGVVVTVRKTGWPHVKVEGFPLLWVILLLVCYAILNVQVVSRYLLLILPMIVVYGVWGIKRLELESVISPRQGLLILLIVSGVSLTQNQYLYRRWVVPHMERFELGVNECLKPIAYWLRSNSQPGATILTPDIGVIGYISERNVYETVDPATFDEAQTAHTVSSNDLGRERKQEQIVRPDFVIDRAPVPDRLASPTLVPIMTKPFDGIGLANPGLMYYTLYQVVK